MHLAGNARATVRGTKHATGQARRCLLAIRGSRGGHVPISATCCSRASNHGGDDVSRRVAQAACGSDTSGSDHDDEDDSDSEVSLRCEFVDNMAAGRVAQRAIG